METESRIVFARVVQSRCVMGICPREIKACVYTETDVPSTFIHDSQKLDTTQIPTTNKWIRYL